MKTGYLGLDIGSISTKGVVIADGDRIVAEQYLWTEGNPVEAVRRVLHSLKEQAAGYAVAAAGVTGSARRLIGAMVGADVVKNEITAHAVGTLTVFPSVRTIFEIGGQDSKIILIENGVVTDYAMNTLCAAGTGAFLSSQAGRLGINVEEFGAVALTSQKPTKIAARCTVFAESDLVHKAQVGHKREDIVAGLCFAVVGNYLNNVGKGKQIKAPIVFQGGVSRNVGVVRAFEEVTGERILVDPNGHLMGALGAAVLSKRHARGAVFDFGVADMRFETVGRECGGCPNHCEIICFYKNGLLVDAWGNRCANGEMPRAVPQQTEMPVPSVNTAARG